MYSYMFVRLLHSTKKQLNLPYLKAEHAWVKWKLANYRNIIKRADQTTTTRRTIDTLDINFEPDSYEFGARADKCTFVSGDGSKLLLFFLERKNTTCNNDFVQNTFLQKQQMFEIVWMWKHHKCDAAWTAHALSIQVTLTKVCIYVVCV